MKPAVTDANIFIDLIELELLHLLFDLGYSKNKVNRPFIRCSRKAEPRKQCSSKVCQFFFGLASVAHGIFILKNCVLLRFNFKLSICENSCSRL
ncbi:MAG: hypothetical protein CRN43_06050 [Candidatus Nephrothrix sp. EaCA]|nr:MAG: hypothetical protein CRN43_06050 [Candidatus Nephrothrix sp. EaCA]